MARSPLLARNALRLLSQRSQSTTAGATNTAAPVRFQQIEWRRAWTAEEQAAQAKHAALQKAVGQAQAKDAKLLNQVCEDLISAVGANWKLELTTSGPVSYTHLRAHET